MGAARLKGCQLDLVFPIRGRPTKRRALEKAGQMRIPFAGVLRCSASAKPMPAIETLDDALQATFPIRPFTDDEQLAEFERLFPPNAKG